MPENPLDNPIVMQRSTIGLALLGIFLFCMPWIEIRCEADPATMLSQALPGAPRETVASSGIAPITIVRSGLQMALNQQSVYENGKPVEQTGAKVESQGIGIDVYFAIVYALAMIGCLVLAVARPRLWAWIAACAGGTALAMLLCIELFSWTQLKADMSRGAPPSAPLPNMVVSRQFAYYASYLVTLGLAAIGVHALLLQRQAQPDAAAKGAPPAPEL